MRNIILLLLLIGAVAVFCALFTGRAPLPKANWQAKELTTEDGILAILKDKRLTLSLSPEDSAASGALSAAAAPFYNTPDNLKVQDFLFSDIDHDGRQELLVLLWRIGRYGTARPFWVTEEEKTYSQHLFIYYITDDLKVKEKWCASDVGKDIFRMKTMERDPSVLVTEDVEGETTLWRWESWGMKAIDSRVKVLAFGDNIIHDEVMQAAEELNGGSYDFLYEPFKEELESADLAAIQLETVLVDNNSDVSGYPYFGAPLAVGEAIADAGFDVAVCANNHILDKGTDGIKATTDFFAEKKVTVVGVHSPEDSEKAPYEIVMKKGIKIALFAYTYGTNMGDARKNYPGMISYLPGSGDESAKEELLKDLSEARQEADIVIVFVHWGNEYETEVSDRQKAWAELFAEGGADVVIGSHPHVVQEMTTLDRPDGGETIVYYSLGNFRAHQGRRPETRQGAGAVIYLEHTFDGVRVKNYDMFELDSYVE
jgi:hypothetical protein